MHIDAYQSFNLFKHITHINTLILLLCIYCLFIIVKKCINLFIYLIKITIINISGGSNQHF